jgi:hypothetical protein
MLTSPLLLLSLNKSNSIKKKTKNKEKCTFLLNLIFLMLKGGEGTDVHYKREEGTNKRLLYSISLPKFIPSSSGQIASIVPGPPSQCTLLERTVRGHISALADRL